jgi:hypothetical protein
VLGNLAVATENQVPMAAEMLGLLLVSVAREDKGDARGGTGDATEYLLCH